MQLRQCETSRSGRLLASGWIVPALLGAVLLNILVVWGGADGYMGMAPTLFVLYMTSISCVIAAFTAWWETRVQTRPAHPSLNSGRRWVDFYAGSDPVPQGSLHENLPRQSVRSDCIVNRRSFLSDHTTYWQNKPEFVTRVVAELDREAGLLGIPGLEHDRDYRRARRHHRDTMIVLSLGWWAYVLSLFAWATFQLERLAQSGRDWLAALRGTPLEFVTNSVAAPGAMVVWSVAKLTDSVPQYLDSLGYAAVVLGGAALAGYLWWKSVVVVFTKWNSASLADFLNHENEKFWGKYGTLLVWPFMDLFVLLPLAVAFCLWVNTSPWVFALQAVGWAVTIIYSLLLLYAGLASLPKNRSALIAALRKFGGYIAAATRPASDAPERPGAWQAWSAFRGLGGMLLVIPVLVGVGAEKWLHADDVVATRCTGFGIALIDVLLVVRLVRLTLQRGYSVLVGILLSVVAAGATAYLLMNRHDPTTSLLDNAALGSPMMLMLLAIAYFVSDRILPVRVPR